MSRSVTVAAACLFVFLLPHLLTAADQTAKPGPTDGRGKKEVLAALEAEAAGDNARRTELLSQAATLAPELAEVNWHQGRV